MKRLFYIFLFCLPFLAIAQPERTAYDYKILDQHIKTILHQQNGPGAQLVIVNKEGILWRGNYGYADLENERPVTDETMFRIGSITKSFVAVSVMMLVEKGQLNLNDPVKELAPELPFANPWEKTSPAKLVHLLEHTAGFDDMHLMEYATNGAGWTTLEGLQYHPHSKTSRWQPGQHMSYCNSGPPMAAYMVEKKTGQTIEDFIDQNIFGPLNMPTSSLLKTETVEQRLSKGYVGSEQKEAPYWHIINRSAGAINSTATEMAQYVRFFLNRGKSGAHQLLSPESVQRIETPTSTLAAKAGVKEGYGLHIQTQSYRGVNMHGHGGGMSGFLANMQYIPELDVGYIFFINKSNGMAMNTINQAILDCVVPPVPDIHVRAMDHHSLDIHVQEIEGYYRTATSRNQLFRFLEWPTNILQIKEKEGQLFLKPLAGGEMSLGVIDQNHYRLHYGKGYSSPVVFVQDENGKQVLQLPNTFGNYYQTNAAAVWGPLYLFNISSLLLLTAHIYAFFWIPIWLFGRRKIRNVQARLWPLLAAISIQAFILLLTIGGGTDPITQFGNQTPVSNTIYILSLLAPALSLIAFWVSMRAFETKMPLLARIHAFLVSMACLTMTAYLGYWGLLGLRMWMF